MVGQKEVDLIKRLHEKTMEGKIAWEATTYARNFQASFPGYSIRISDDPDDHGIGSDYLLQIFDSENRLIDDFTDMDIFNASPESKPYSLMRDIYDEARRRGFGVNQAIDDLLAVLA